MVAGQATNDQLASYNEQFGAARLARSQLPVYDGFSNRVFLMLTRWPFYELFGDFLGVFRMTLNIRTVYLGNFFCHHVHVIFHKAVVNVTRRMNYTFEAVA